MATITRGAALVLVSIAMATCARDVRPPRPHALVIVTLDTTRADRLPMYGFASVTTPALERLAREGIVFDRATSVAPLTLTAHTSLFTGLYPPHHGVRDNANPALNAATPTLAAILQAQGFHTGAFVGSTVLAADRGLSRGFDVYDDGRSPGVTAPRRRPGNEVVDRALAWLDAQGGSPFLLWVHLYDAHAPQRLPDDYRRTYGDSYVGGIAFEDAQVGRLLDALDRKRLRDTTAVIVAGDHGESLGDHGELEHGIFLYEGTLHIPMILRGSGIAPRRVASLASLVDVLPTALDLLRVAPIMVDGLSLLPTLKGGPQPMRRGVYAESMYPRRFGWSPLRALLDERFKYIDAPRPELYDLDVDPFETHDLAAERPATAVAMRKYLEALGRTDADEGGHTGATVTPEVRERLAALGYTSGTTDRTQAGALDPKDYIQVYNASRQHGPR